ncbi:helix-turn-helix transcriptional regulator [Ornithinimicrobium cerasi]|uniref:helix-turn-helix transcriptional regulator n=1 Tax=Ornithinimicrobium cerasi TaxID=2248773 RepID=UPI000EFF3D35|nr:helix-turn-helix transcriptional regulator [Ornithinimicrobium cerasi]
MATVGARTRSRERLERLAASGVSSEELQRETVAELQRVVGFDRWCWPSADPLTLLPGQGLAEHDFGPHLPRVLDREYSGSDVATKEQAARAGSSLVCLSRLTGRDLARSGRWDDVLRAVGIGDVVVLACRDRHGCWGWVEAYRDQADGPFATADLGMLAELAPVLGAAMRRRAAASWDQGSEKASPDGGREGETDAEMGTPAGVVLLDSTLRLVGSTPTASRWVDALPAARLFAGWGILPPAVYAAASRARTGADRTARHLGPSVDGGWVQVEAARVSGSDQVAVTLRAGTEREIFSRAARAHGLSARERQVASLLVAGHDTSQIARALVISPWTVQDHLKSVFAKLGVHSRGGVIARLGGPRPVGVPGEST